MCANCADDNNMCIGKCLFMKNEKLVQQDKVIKIKKNIISIIFMITFFVISLLKM